jgi:hypothetical protein
MDIQTCCLCCTEVLNLADHINEHHIQLHQEEQNMEVEVEVGEQGEELNFHEDHAQLNQDQDEEQNMEVEILCRDEELNIHEDHTQHNQAQTPDLIY